jgi:hypothetical protein
MSFEIETLTKAKCTEVLVLSQKNREPYGVTAGLCKL